MVALLASEWGWTEADVDSCAWFNVHQYVKEARKAWARRTNEMLTLLKGTDESVEALHKRVVSVMRQDVSREEIRADQLEEWSRLMKGSDPENAARLRQQAAYIRYCKEHGLDA